MMLVVKSYKDIHYVTQDNEVYEYLHCDGTIHKGYRGFAAIMGKDCWHTREDAETALEIYKLSQLSDEEFFNKELWEYTKARKIGELTIAKNSNGFFILVKDGDAKSTTYIHNNGTIATYTKAKELYYKTRDLAVKAVFAYLNTAAPVVAKTPEKRLCRRPDNSLAFAVPDGDNLKSVGDWEKIESNLGSYGYYNGGKNEIWLKDGWFGPEKTKFTDFHLPLEFLPEWKYVGGDPAENRKIGNRAHLQQKDGTMAAETKTLPNKLWRVAPDNSIVFTDKVEGYRNFEVGMVLEKVGGKHERGKHKITEIDGRRVRFDLHSVCFLDMENGNLKDMVVVAAPLQAITSDGVVPTNIDQWCVSRDCKLVFTIPNKDCRQLEVGDRLNDNNNPFTIENIYFDPEFRDWWIAPRARLICTTEGHLSTETGFLGSSNHLYYDPDGAIHRDWAEGRSELRAGDQFTSGSWSLIYDGLNLTNKYGFCIRMHELGKDIDTNGYGFEMLSEPYKLTRVESKPTQGKGGEVVVAPTSQSVIETRSVSVDPAVSPAVLSRLCYHRNNLNFQLCAPSSDWIELKVGDVWCNTREGSRHGDPPYYGRITKIDLGSKSVDFEQLVDNKWSNLGKWDKPDTFIARGRYVPKVPCYDSTCTKDYVAIVFEEPVGKYKKVEVGHLMNSGDPITKIEGDTFYWAGPLTPRKATGSWWMAFPPKFANQPASPADGLEREVADNSEKSFDSEYTSSYNGPSDSPNIEESLERAIDKTTKKTPLIVVDSISQNGEPGIVMDNSSATPVFLAYNAYNNQLVWTHGHDGNQVLRVGDTIVDQDGSHWQIGFENLHCVGITRGLEKREEKYLSKKTYDLDKWSIYRGGQENVTRWENTVGLSGSVKNVTASIIQMVKSRPLSALLGGLSVVYLGDKFVSVGEKSMNLSDLVSSVKSYVAIDGGDLLNKAAHMPLTDLAIYAGLTYLGYKLGLKGLRGAFGMAGVAASSGLRSAFSALPSWVGVRQFVHATMVTVGLTGAVFSYDPSRLNNAGMVGGIAFALFNGIAWVRAINEKAAQKAKNAA